MKKCFLAGILFSLLGGAAWAGSVCPASTGFNAFPHAPDPSGTGCNVVITIHPDNSVTVAVTDPTSYVDDLDDTLVGVVNNSSTPITRLNLSGPDIFDFDGDGICRYSFTGSSYCQISLLTGNDPYEYEGPTSTFTVTNLNAGSVNFNSAIPGGGGTTYFALDNAPNPDLQVTIGGTTTPTVPTLSTWGILLLGGLLMGYSVRTIWLAYRPQA